MITLRILPLLASAFLLAVSPASAQLVFSGNYVYTRDGAAATLVGLASPVENVVIPATIDGLPIKTVDGIGPAPPFRAQVRTITIADGVTTIGDRAFQLLTNLESATLPDSVVEMGEGAFLGCESLTQVTLPANLTTLEGTFTGCRSLTRVSLPPGLTTLDGTFLDCSSLESIVLPAGVTRIDRAFVNCSSLVEVTWPDNLQVLGEEAFLACTALVDPNLPATLTSIEARAFKDCTGLVGLTLPAGVLGIGEEAFEGCSNLTAIDLPAALRTIGPAAFRNCTALGNLDLPPGVLDILDRAFMGCSSLQSVSLPAGLRTIGSSSFSGCGLTGIVVPESVTSIGDQAFWNCPDLVDISLPDRYLASLSLIGFDFVPQVATDKLIEGIANNLANNPDFVTMLANEIIAQTGHYGLATQGDVSTLDADRQSLEDQLPGTIRSVIAQVDSERPAPDAITSDLEPLSTTQGLPLEYAVTTNFAATDFSATGLPAGLTIDASSGIVSGRILWPGSYSVFLHAGIPGGPVASAVKVFEVTPRTLDRRRGR